MRKIRALMLEMPLALETALFGGIMNEVLTIGSIHLILGPSSS